MSNPFVTFDRMDDLSSQVDYWARYELARGELLKAVCRYMDAKRDGAWPEELQFAKTYARSRERVALHAAAELREAMQMGFAPHTDPRSTMAVA